MVTSQNFENESVSTLTGNLGFQKLLEWFEEYLNTELTGISQETDPREAFRRLRRWQTLKFFANVLKTAPETLRDTLVNNADSFPDHEPEFWLGRGGSAEDTENNVSF